MSNARRKGFTLIELMVVIVILGALVALVGPNVWNALVGGTRKTAKFQIENFKRAIQSYYLDKRTMPQSLTELTNVNPSTGEQWLTEVPNDPWDRPYEYRLLNPAKREYMITSSGSDQQAGTDDDLEYHSTEGFKGE
jgi:general secretion pathway protein G